MRVSARESDPDYVPSAYTCELDIYLDDVKMTCVISADEENGVIEAYKLDAKGLPLIKGVETETHFLYGKVELRPKNEKQK